MLTFVHTGQQQPPVRSPEERAHDFHEIYAQFARDKAAEQASRCSQCGIPFCQVHCPLQNNIPDWLMLTAEGRLEEAYQVSAATNTFPEICGRICPQDRLCEGNCVIEKGFKSVTIGAVERYITETAFDNGWVRPPAPARELGTSIGIIGAGPAGLAAADMLRRKGHGVTVYDRYDRAGGLLMYGIPSFKLEKEVVERRNTLLSQGGVRFRMNVDIGRDISFAELRGQHDAVLIATGVYRARAIEVPGADLPGVVPALAYLTASNRKGLGDAVPEFDGGDLDARGRHVVVVGGGDTAMDCVRTAIRQEAASVTCLYRRDRANMPGSQREVKNAEEEGVKFLWLSQPRAFIHADDGNGRVSGVMMQEMRLLPTDASGRQASVPVEGSQRTLPADMVITALGFEPEDLTGAYGEPQLAVTRYGTLQVDPRTLMTPLPGVFAAGDIVRGASLVVWAIRDGREAAEGIHAYVRAMKQMAA